jgi:LysM domain-containing protein
MAQGIPTGQVRLINQDAKFDHTLLLADTPPKITGGGELWDIVDRPRQVSMTVYKGRAPFQVELAVMLDGLAPLVEQGGYSQEPVIRDLLAAMTGDDEQEPSTWEIQGVPEVNDIPEWVLQNAEPGDHVIRRRTDFSRTRQDYTLTFVEYTPPTYVQIRAKARQGAKSKTILYAVKKGDTPASIARKRRCKWTDLRTLNQSVVKRANQNLKDGTRIRVPVLKASTKRPRKTIRTPARS